MFFYYSGDQWGAAEEVKEQYSCVRVRVWAKKRLARLMLGFFFSFCGLQDLLNYVLFMIGT